MIDININNFEEEVLKSDKPVLIKFYAAQGCGFCDKYVPVFEEFATKHPEIKCVQAGRATLRMEQNELEKMFDIKSFPQTVAYYKGEYLQKEAGVLNETKLLNMVRTIEQKSDEELYNMLMAYNKEIIKEENKISKYRDTVKRIVLEVEKRHGSCEAECIAECGTDKSCIETCKDICKHGRSCMSPEDKQKLKEYLTNK